MIDYIYTDVNLGAEDVVWTTGGVPTTIRAFFDQGYVATDLNGVMMLNNDIEIKIRIAQAATITVGDTITRNSIVYKVRSREVENVLEYIVKLTRDQ